MHLSGKMALRLVDLGVIGQEDLQQIRLAAMLHDIGHGPFSHIYEELLLTKRGMTHEDLTRWIILNTELADYLNEFGYEPETISSLAVGKNPSNPIHNQVISGYFDADVMDYLIRDSLHTGVEYGYIDVTRLVDSLTVVDDIVAIDSASVYAVESFYFARYMMFKAVYFHKTVRAADVMISKAMTLANDKIGLTSFKEPERFLELDDRYVVERIIQSVEVDDQIMKAKEIIQRLNSRKLFKMAFEAFAHQPDKILSSLLMNPRIKGNIEREIARDAGIDEDYVILDLSSVPSLPYRPAYTEDKGRITMPIAFKDDEGLYLKSLYEISALARGIAGFVDIVRVYTPVEFREKVAAVSKKLFGEQPFSYRVSF